MKGCGVIDLTDPTLPDNYLQLKAALERACDDLDKKNRAVVRRAGSGDQSLRVPVHSKKGQLKNCGQNLASRNRQ
jgi:hypothetical protein